MLTAAGRVPATAAVRDPLRGLRPVLTVTKTRTDVLVTAEAGIQSGKAREARQYGKPALDAGQLQPRSRSISDPSWLLKMRSRSGWSSTST